MSKKRDIYNMEEYGEDGYDDMYGGGENMEEPSESGDVGYAGDEIYPELTRDRYPDDYEEEESYQPPPSRGGRMQEDEDQYYDLYDPQFQEYLLRNGIIEYDDDDNSTSTSSSDDDYVKPKKRTTKKKTTRKKKTTKKKSRR